MGCGCNFGNLKTEEKNEFVNTDFCKVEESIKDNPDSLNSIVKIQSCYRGMKIRSLIKNMELTRSNCNINITSNSQVIDINNFHPTETSQITQEELNMLLNDYPPLNDNIKVEINGPIQYDNNN